MQEAFKQYVERPATLCIPLLLATFSVGNGAAIYRPDFFDVPTDFWLSTYWLLLCGMLIYLLVYGSRALLILRRDPRSRRIANIYLLASASGVIACAIRIITAYVPPTAAPRGRQSGVVLRLHAAARVSPWPRRTPGGSRRSGSSGRPTEGVPQKYLLPHPFQPGKLSWAAEMVELCR